MTLVQAPPESLSPAGPFYVNERGLYPFQADQIAQALALREQTPGMVFSWSAGLGKSHAAMAASALALEDGDADVAIVVCEKVKLREWLADFQRFTSLDARIHHGSSRARKMAKEGWPQVLITTYETAKIDFTSSAQVKGGRGRSVCATDLLDDLTLPGRRPVFFFDEADRLSNRSSGIYKSMEFMLKHLRRDHGLVQVYGLTGTLLRRDTEGAFNVLRLIAPGAMPTVADFKAFFVNFRDAYDRPRYHEDRLPVFAELAAPVLLVKDKQDADVRAQFPAMVEEPLWLDLEGGQRDLYRTLEGLEVDGTLMLLRQVCAHPAALLHSAEHGTSKLARTVVDELGADWLRSLSSAKTEELVRYLKPIVRHQCDKAVVFSFFGPSVLPLLRAALEAAGVPCWSHDDRGGVEAFRASPTPGVLLCSDAAARGINLPEASYLVEYDLAPTYGTRTQRINRVSRIGQGGPSVTVRTMLVRETVEVPLLHTMLRGHAQSDILLGVTDDGGRLTAGLRRQLLSAGAEKD